MSSTFCPLHQSTNQPIIIKRQSQIYVSAARVNRPLLSFKQSYLVVFEGVGLFAVESIKIIIKIFYISFFSAEELEEFTKLNSSTQPL